MENNTSQKVSCVANYPYDAVEPDELSIRQGDVVHEVDRLPGGWWRGELRGKVGMFPDNFVTVITDQNNVRPSNLQRRCRAVFSYQPANPDELPLSVGDVLEVLSEVEEGWWQGRRQGRVGVFPSNFVVMLDSLPAPTYEPAPKLPPKPVKEQCRVLFPYSAVNEDELSLSEGDIINIVSKEAPDRGWWRGEVNGKIGLFPDNFVQIIPPVAQSNQDVEEKKPERPPVKTNAIYPVLNKYSEKTASVKELTTSRISLHKENTLSKESTTQSTVTHTNKMESEKIVHNETVPDTSLDGQVKKPPVPLKKSPTPTTGVGGLFSGLKSKMLSTSEKEKDKDKEKERDKEKEKEKEKDKSPSTTLSNTSSSSGEWDRPDGAATSRTHTFDHVERHSILNDPRAGRVKAPRRRPPSQAFRDDGPPLSNGHDAPATVTAAPTAPVAVADIPPEKTEAVKPRTREWEKHKAPWMAELKLNQAKKTSQGDKRPTDSSGKSTSTEKLLECGLEEKRSTHSMEMSKSTSSISSRISVLESFEELQTTTRNSLDSNKKDSLPRDSESHRPNTIHSPSPGQTLSSMLDDVLRPPAPSPPTAKVRTSTEISVEKSPNKTERTIINTEKFTDLKPAAAAEKSNTLERIEKMERRESAGEKTSTIERRHFSRTDKSEGTDVIIAQLNDRITNLEKRLEVKCAEYSAAIQDLKSKLTMETEKRVALQAELDKFAHCVTQV